MNDLFISNIMSLLVFALLYVTFLFTPQLSRKDLIFGVFIPLERTKDIEIQNISKKYSKELTLFTLVVLIIYFILLNTIFQSPIMIISIPLFIIGYFYIFLGAHNKIKTYKSENNLVGNKKQIVYVNTSMSNKLRKNAVIPYYWFIIPLIISSLNLFIPLMRYDELPAKIATHWNISGVADNFVNKSLGSVFVHGLIPIGLVIILAFSNFTIAISKNKIDASNPVSSSEKLFKFKKINSIMIYTLTVVIIPLITFFNMNSLNIISVNVASFTPLFIVLFISIVLLPIIIYFKLGQGGINLKDNANEKIDNTVSNIDDDEFWKLGSLYYNPNDPSLFVEKRFGIGWTLNYGNKLSIVITVLFIIFILLILSLPLFFS